MGELSRITKQGKWDYKVGRAYKVGQLLLQKGETFITNFYYKSGLNNNQFHYNNFAKMTYDFNVDWSRFTA